MTVREVDAARLEELDDRLLELVIAAKDEGFSLLEVSFAFARATYRLMTPEGEPPAGRANFVNIVGTHECACDLRIETGDCPIPDTEEDHVTH